MQYKTIVLELLEQRAQYHETLRRQRQLLATLEAFAEELKSFHEKRKAQLRHNKPQSDPAQIASEALELAIDDLTSQLPAERPATEDEPLS